ncbi:MjaI family restriction endonuclease [bacterium]|nr:MjaI family restriction endonuclease [bacterium]
MDKEWISGCDGKNLKFKKETLLNYGMNRWGLNKAHSVGPTSELIRACAPKSFEEWENFYFSNARQKKKNGLKITREYIRGLGETLYIKLSEVVQNELDSIQEEECIDYAYNLVLNRTYEGYQSEIDTIYGQLGSILNVKIEPAPDKWDRSYNIDFYIQVNQQYIGLQIKPISSGQSLNKYQWIEMHRKNHERFTAEFGGKVFFIFSVKSTGKKKKIYNVEIIDEIIEEIKRISS